MGGTPDSETHERHEQLVTDCVRGDQPACAAIYRQHADMLYRHLCVLLGPGAEAEDALQQTFMEAFRKLDDFAGRSKLSTWLHGIAVRVALNAMRSQKRRRRAMGAFEQERADASQLGPSTPESRTESRRQLARLEMYLDRVSPDKRVAFLLYYVEQRELGEVAELMGASSNTTLVRLRRTREKLLRELERDAKTRRAAR